ncbi:MAG TPA: hypothetical protein VFT32_01000, partial [Candidatus Eisenbacteria bacterium]|nr:hypothetical protein [Candidatus Eisenbacteria bacterium]
IGAAILAALTSAPLAISRREAAPRATPPEIVSLASTSSRAVSFPDLDVKSAWEAHVGLHLSGAPVPRGAEARFIDAFFDGRLPAAAGFVRSALAKVDAPRAARIADKARSFDRALIQLSPAPEPLLRAFVERAEDPDAHVEATRANAEEIARLVADPALGERAFDLLRATQAIPATALQALSRRVARDAWARAGLGALGPKAVPALLEALDSDDGVRRAAGAWVLAVIGDPAHVERILQAALPELARDEISGNAAFAIRALTALGERARPAVRGLLKSADDQALAGALQVLMKTGGASAVELDAARSRVERLAARAGEAGDEAAIGLELRAALAVTAGAMTVPDPPEKLNPSQTESSGRSW